MCGQFGMAGSLSGTDEKNFQKLMIFNSVRGIDSTGAASVKRGLNNGEIEIIVAKEVGHPFNLLGIKRKDEHDFTDIVAGTQRALLGHCRASTRGATNRYNAHPFYFSHVVGTHNGTLSYESHQKLIGAKKFDTDSESIFNEIEAVGISETVKKFRGYKPEDRTICPDAYALVWYDDRGNTMNFLRNKERPLTIAFDQKRERMYWSSEKEHLIAAMTDIPHDEKFLIDIPENHHYQYEIPHYGQAFAKARAAKMEGNIPVPFVGGSGKITGGKHGNQNAYAAWEDKTTYMWKRWRGATGGYIFAISEFGVYYDTPQLCWDNMTENEKLRRLSKYEIPPGVATGYYLSQITQTWEKHEADTSVEEKGKAIIVRRGTEAETHLKLVSDNQNEINHKIVKLKEEKLEILTKPLLECIKVHHSPDLRAYFNGNNKTFHVFTFSSMAHNQPWNAGTYKTCPDIVPFTKLDIRARHHFKHVKHGKEKIPYYRGWDGAMLVRQTFEKLMKSGCADCKRTPEWGNEVEFISKELFVCEFCSKDREKVKLWKSVAEIDDNHESIKQVLN